MHVPGPPAPRFPVGPKVELQIMMASSFESNIHEDLEEEIMNLVDAQAAPDRLKRHTGWNVKISCFKIQQPILKVQISNSPDLFSQNLSGQSCF